MEYKIEIKNEKRFSDKIVLFLFCLYFILKPFYLWSSGLPQISDCVFVLLLLFYIIKKKLIVSFYSRSKGFLLAGLGFVIYVMIINTVWALLLDGSVEFFITSAFYIYNYAAGFMVLALFQEYDDILYKHIYSSVLISTFIQLALYLTSGGFEGSRALAFFNNPNQLGYHNLLILGYLVMIEQRNKLNPLLFILGVIASSILCFSSLSKAAIIAYSGMMLFFMVICLVTKASDKRLLIYLLVIILIFTAVYFINREAITSNQLYISVMNRISRVGLDKDDNLMGRGYYRLMNYPQYLIFGAGEGEYVRFGYNMEFHSTLGNILMSYGIIGLFLYLSSIVFAAKTNRWKNAYIIFFILLYGLTHNGIRNTLFWMLVALINGAYTKVNPPIHIGFGKKVR